MPEDQIPDRIQSILAFDFGTKRMGVAIGQRITATASALEPIKAKDGIPNWQQLEAVVAEWQPDAFVVGLPLNMDGSVSEMSRRASKFARRLNGRFHKPSYTQDERLSSFEAKGEVMRHHGQRDFGQYSVDGLAACIILESWMEQHPSGTSN